MNNDNATAAEVKALRKTVSDLAAKVENLEELVAESHKVILAFSQPADRTAQHQVRETRAGEDYRVDVAEESESPMELIEDAEDWSSLTGKDIPEVVLQGRKGEKLLAELVRVYSAFPKVQAIAVGPYLDEIRVFVLVEMKQHYDGKLVGRLIDVEYDLHGKFKPLCLAMSYPPVGDLDLSQTKYDVGTIIWRRGSVECE